MRERTITTPEELQRASTDLLKLEGHLPVVITLTEGSRIRTSAQNARHWCDIASFMQEISDTVEKIAEYTGHTPLEVKRILVKELPEEQGVILFTKSDKAVHEVLKGICNIPTSTRLGTKEFSKFDDILAQTMMDIIGSINAITA